MVRNHFKLRIPRGQRDENSKIREILKSVLVDDQDKHLLLLGGLFISRHGYIIRRDKRGVLKHIFLHHMIIGKPTEGMVVDHINGNKLDNRRHNLRFVKISINNANRKKRIDSKQLFKGIRVLPGGGYQARGGGLNLGIFDNPEGAYRKYKSYFESKYDIDLIHK